ncbi:MAG: hypothetical protein RLZ98_590 [Pseudomonadota bacterium]|jgi:1-hydroxy-2-naphthoate dioxygenase
MTDGSNRSANGDLLALLAERMSGMHMRGQWQNETNRSDGSAWNGDMLLPTARGKPWIWRAADVHGFLTDATEALPESMTSRRSVLFNNPGLQRGTVATINMGIQMILPGETAWAHRHSISALRFVVKGDAGLMTTVDGVGCRMETGDLVLTPGGSWHDHYNGGNAPLMWLDVLDGPVMAALNQSVFQNYGDKRQPVQNAAPSGGGLRFAWSDTCKALDALNVQDPRRGHVHDFLDAGTGGHPMRTLGCRMLRLPQGFVGESWQPRSNSVFHAFKGSGSLVADGATIEWEEGDCFAVPGWCQRSFSTREGAHLFEVHDEPLLECLGLVQGAFADAVRSKQDREGG